MVGLKRFKSYVRDLSKLLLLGDWHIILTIKARTDDDADFAVTNFAELGTAEITFYSVLFDESEEFIRETVVHELLHLHFRRLNEVMESSEPVLGVAAYGILMRNQDAAEESTVQTLARILAPLCPLP